jgi:hypothetical protein
MRRASDRPQAWPDQLTPARRAHQCIDGDLGQPQGAMTRTSLGQANHLLVVESARRVASHHQAAFLQLDRAPP